MSPAGAAKQRNQSKDSKLESKNRKGLDQKLPKSEANSSVQSGINGKSTGGESVESVLSNSSLPTSDPSSLSSTSSKASRTGKRGNKTDNSASPQICKSLDEFSAKAQDLKAEVKKSLAKQLVHQVIDQPTEVMKLKNEILKLSITDPQSQDDTAKDNQNAPANTVAGQSGEQLEHESHTKEDSHQEQTGESTSLIQPDLSLPTEKAEYGPTNQLHDEKQKGSQRANLSRRQLSNLSLPNSTPDKKFEEALTPLDMVGWSIEVKKDTIATNLLNSFQDAPHLIKSLCNRLVIMSEQLKQSRTNYQNELEKGRKMERANEKLKELCRELQKSNNAIRIESLDLIKVEQSKAKEQTTKIQSTLSGVIKLFDENQQRNMSLRQENQELQVKLKSLLDHCDSWEKSVEITLRQRDIDNRLLRTELAKANLSKNEEKEKFLSEKQELLQILSTMQEQQHKIEGQEAKLRSDLSSYASKYDECQAFISKGMDKFQVESKRMLKQIEKSNQDYKVLLTKYETTNRKMAQMLEEKQYWNKAMSIANRKIETLEKLCRAMREQKPDELKQSKSSTSGKKQTNSKWRNKAEDKEGKSQPKAAEEAANHQSSEEEPTQDVSCHDIEHRDDHVEEDRVSVSKNNCIIAVSDASKVDETDAVVTDDCIRVEVGLESQPNNCTA